MNPKTIRNLLNLAADRQLSDDDAAAFAAYLSGAEFDAKFDNWRLVCGGEVMFASATSAQMSDMGRGMAYNNESILSAITRLNLV